MEPPITTTPPVHDPGPAGPDSEIEGGEASRVGLDSLLMDEFKAIMTEMAARNTRVVVAAPLRQLVDAVMRIVPDLPRVPDYDDVSARRQEWGEATAYSPFELPERAPSTLGVQADGGTVTVRATVDGADFGVKLDADHAEGFFLAGLAAVRHAKVVKAEAERERERERGALILPEGFSRR